MIPTKDRPELLRQAVSSVLSQSLTDVEVVVVDDGSEVQPTNALRSLDDGRLVHVSTGGAGRSVARNTGIGLSRGEFLAFLDDDDWFLPDKLERQVAFLRAHPGMDVVASGVQITDANGTVQHVWKGWESQPILTFERLVTDCPVHLAGCLVRRSSRLCRFDPDMVPAEDTQWFLALLHRGGHAAWLRSIVAAYRQHHGSSQALGRAYCESLAAVGEFIVSASNESDDPVFAAKVRSHYATWGGLRAYDGGETALGLARIRDGWELLRDHLPIYAGLEDTLVAYARQKPREQRRLWMEGIVEAIQAALPESGLSRRRTCSQMHMAQVFADTVAGRRPRFGDWIRGVVSGPRWLADWGVWTAGLESLVGHRWRPGRLSGNVTWWPKLVDLAENPYWLYLGRTLEAQGVVFENSHSGHYLSTRWLWKNRARVQVLHFHWLQSHYAGPDNRVDWARMGKFAYYLSMARLLGYRLVWTLHDAKPTWPMTPWIGDKLGFLLMSTLAHDVIVHCLFAESVLRRQYFRLGAITVAKHPPFPVGKAADEAAARRRLDVRENERVVLFFGGLRPNKGLDDLVTAFRILVQTDESLRLFIVGRPWPPAEFIARLERLVASTPSATLDSRYVHEEVLRDYLAAADVVVLPFTDILTSSSAMLAKSYGLPLVVPSRGCLPEMVGEADEVYDADDSTQLAPAIRRALDRSGNAGTVTTGAKEWELFGGVHCMVYSGAGTAVR